MPASEGRGGAVVRSRMEMGKVRMRRGKGKQLVMKRRARKGQGGWKGGVWMFGRNGE